MGGVLDRKCKLALQTRVTHAMPASELNGFVDGQLIVHADETIDPKESVYTMLANFEILTLEHPCALAYGATVE